jgi:hypothetical protein
MGPAIAREPPMVVFPVTTRLLSVKLLDVDPTPPIIALELIEFAGRVIVPVAVMLVALTV